MNLAERITRHVTGVVWLSGLAVWLVCGFAGWAGLGGGWTAVLVVGVLALLHSLARAGVVQAVLPGLERIGELARQTRRMAEEGSLDARLVELDDPEIAEISRSINLLVGKVQAERATVAAESLRSRTMAEGSPNGVLVIGARGQIDYFNPAFARLFVARTEPVGLRPIEAFEVAAVQRVVDEVVETAASVELPAATGESEVVLRGVPLGDGSTMVVCTDITPFRQAEQARTDFVTNVSHELRTPIAAIMGFAETLEGDDLPASSQRLVKAIVRNGRRLSELFEDLLALAKIEARRRELPTSMRKLAPLIDEALTTARDRAATKGQHLLVHCPPDVTARINPQALVAIVSNLALNASNYTPEGGTIEVDVARDEDVAVVTVRDDGIGIEPSQLGRIFERFYRVDSGRARKDGGTGLGLAIVKHLCRASDADVGVQSAVGEGSVFTVRFPAT